MNIVTIVTRNASTILTVAGIAGMAGASILTAMATPKAMLKIEQLKENLPDPEVVIDEETNEATTVEPELSKKDILKATWIDYAPAVACMAGGIACIVVAKRIDAAKIAALASTCALLDEKLQLHDKALNALEPADREKVQEKIDEEVMKDVPPWHSDTEIVAWDPEHSNPAHMMPCIESLSGQLFWSNPDRIRKAERDFNSYIMMNSSPFGDCMCSVSEWMETLGDGVEPTELFRCVGWSSQHPLEVEFNTRLDENDRPVLVLNYRLQPKLMDDRLYN